MEHEGSTSAHGVDALFSASEQRTTEHIQIVVSALERRIYDQINASNTALLGRPRVTTCPIEPAKQQESIPPYAAIATEGGKAAQEPPIDLLNNHPEHVEPEFVDFAAYEK
jgi:hypothetical protein